MKRMTFLLLAAISALFAILVALDAINFETDRIDRWVMIFGFAGVAFFIGLASADHSGEPASRRAAAEQALGANRPDPSDLPARPGSLHRRDTSTADVPDVEEPDLDLVALEIDPVEAELQGMIEEDQLQNMIDDEQMDEIVALVDESDVELPLDEHSVGDGDRAGDRDRVGKSESDEAVSDHVDPAIQPVAHSDSSDIESSADTPIARIELRLADYDDEGLKKLVKESEALVIAEMVRTGQLTSSGELTERDIASMVFLAYTSEEMLAELRLRKSLDQPGDVALTDRALAPLKNIE